MRSAGALVRLAGSQARTLAEKSHIRYRVSSVCCEMRSTSARFHVTANIVHSACRPRAGAVTGAQGVPKLAAQLGSSFRPELHCALAPVLEARHAMP